MSSAPKDPQFESRVRDSFAKQTFMATLGATLARVAPGEVTIALPVREALSQQHGSVHAGHSRACSIQPQATPRCRWDRRVRAWCLWSSRWTCWNRLLASASRHAAESCAAAAP